MLLTRQTGRAGSPSRRLTSKTRNAWTLFSAGSSEICPISANLMSLALVLVHIIFSTKNRIAFLQSPRSPIGGARLFNSNLARSGCEPLRVGGVGDHVYILAGLSRRISL